MTVHVIHAGAAKLAAASSQQAASWALADVIERRHAAERWAKAHWLLVEPIEVSPLEGVMLL